MNAETHILYETSLYKVVDFQCKCDICSTSKKEYQENFSISYVRRGNFIFKVFRNDLEAYNGLFLVNKPNYEHTVSHFDNNPDRCTIFSFTKEFYDQLYGEFGSINSWYFNNNDIQSVLIRANTETEYLHSAIIKAIKLHTFSNLLIDALVFELANKVLQGLSLETNIDPLLLKKKYHFRTIERAKDYILNNITNNISLNDIAGNSFVSAFHFTRVFKSFTGVSPYQYLLETRLKNAEMLLRNTSIPVTQICFESGFNNADYFATAFKKKYNLQPSAVRKGFLSTS